MAIYLQAPGLRGNVTTKGYQQWVALNDVEFPGIYRKVTISSGRSHDRHISQAEFGDITMSKDMDSSSCQWFDAAHSATPFASVDIHYVTTGDPNFTFAKLRLTDALVTYYADSMSTHGSMPLETIRLSYKTIERTFIPRGASNAPESQQVTGFDLAQYQKM